MSSRGHYGEIPHDELTAGFKRFQKELKKWAAEDKGKKSYFLPMIKTEYISKKLIEFLKLK